MELQALYPAIAKGDIDTVSHLLLDAGADHLAVDAAGKTAWDRARSNNNESIVTVLKSFNPA